MNFVKVIKLFISFSFKLLPSYIRYVGIGVQVILADIETVETQVR